MEIIDDFNGEELSDIWSKRKFVPGAIKIQKEIVSSGKGALKITVNEGEKKEVGDSRINTSERAEIQERKDLESLEGKLYSYSFSIFLPKDFPIVPKRLVLAQWKHRESESVKALVNNPVIALRYVDSRLYVTLQDGKKKNIIFTTGEEVKGVWLDFKFKIKFSRGSDGILNIKLNEKEIVDFVGKTCFSKEEGYPEPGKFYFKMGLYRDRMKKPMTAYFDRYRKKEM